MSKSWGKEDWEKCHHDGYGDTVYSVTHDDGLRRLLSDAVKDTSARDILIPGCGSVGLLEKQFSADMPDAHIMCTDFAGSIAEVSVRNKNPRIAYQPLDSTDLRIVEKFDVVVPVNSVLDGEDNENRKMLSQFHQALKPEGKLVGLFPTVFCAFDFILTSQNTKLNTAFQDMLDLKNQTVTDFSHDARQIMYTPLGLRKILLETNFKLEKMEIVFFDSDYFNNIGQRLFGIGKDDPPFYELFVVASKNTLQSPII